MEPFSLAGMEFGCAAAAAQIEGGRLDTNWQRWCDSGHIKDGSSIERAADHWNRYEEDIALQKSLGFTIHRMGLEWARIEPCPGEFDESALGHYRSELERLRGNGIRPLVTLHHFTHPGWFEDAGGFENPACVETFLRYVRYVIAGLGDLAEEYVTINEPNVFATMGYFFGEFPPGKKNMDAAMRVMKNMALCHLASYTEIHRLRREMGFDNTMVGCAHHVRVFRAWGKNPLNLLAAKVMDRFFQSAVIRTMTTGKFVFPFTGGAPFGRGTFSDFLGLNYYTRSFVKAKGFESFFADDCEKNDLGWEIYPQGLSILCREYAKYSLPIWITENGISDSTDEKRTSFIYDHLRSISQANAAGANVTRYYHWTLTDNFEWCEGEASRFGIVALDYQTQERRLRKSGAFYAGAVKNAGVTQALIDEYFG